MLKQQWLKREMVKNFSVTLTMELLLLNELMLEHFVNE